MYLIEPGANLLAIDATTGDEIWEYKRDYPKDLATKIRPVTLSRSKVPALFEDMVYYTAPDGYVVAVDARTGKLRWESKAFDLETKTEHSGGLIVADGKVISNRTCVTRAGCFIVAHDARTGKELWRFYNTAAAGEPGGDSWGDTPSEQRVASSWGLPGSYDAKRRVLYWAVSNPIPYTRLKRHAGNADAVPFESPSELYSNSTLALDIDTGKLLWYYQHLPGDDWDSDHIHERTLIHTRVSPDPRFIKWINPAIPMHEERDIVVEVAEAGDIFALDRATGEFLWAAPFPYDVPNVNMKAIDVKTGRTFINDALVFKKDGDRSVGCFQNTRSYWATSARIRVALRAAPAGRRRGQVHGHDEDRHGDRRDAAHLLAGCARQRLGPHHRRRPPVLGRPQPSLPRLRSRYRQGAVGGDRRRHGDDIDHHLRGRRPAIRRDLHRRRPVGLAQRARHGAEHQAGPRPQRDLRVRAAGGKLIRVSKWRLVQCSNPISRAASSWLRPRRPRAASR
jgi:outer membrane protein assembly factor BamB